MELACGSNFGVMRNSVVPITHLLMWYLMHSPVSHIAKYPKDRRVKMIQAKETNS